MRTRMLLRELKRRGVFRIAAGYTAVAGVTIQGVAMAIPVLGLPPSLLRGAFIVALLGFPVALTLAWFYEITPDAAPSAEPDVPVLPSSKPRPAAAVAAVTLLTLLAAWMLRTHNGPRAFLAAAAPNAQRLAVFPFATMCSANLADYCHGLVDLLNANLDGAAPLQVVPSRAVYGLVRQSGAEAPTAGDASRFAHTLGAGMYIVGRVAEYGGRYRINASVHVGDTNKVRAEAQAEGTDLYAVIDTITAELLAGIVQEPVSDRVRLAQRTTNSLAALKAFVRGEALLRAGENDSAVVAFREAVRQDSVFALGWARLSVAQSWTEVEGGREAALRAARLADKLPARYLHILQAQAARYSGQLDKAETILVKQVSDEPTDIESWFILGDIRLHSGWVRGRSPAQARDAFNRVIAIDRTFDVVDHLAWSEAASDNYARFDSLTREEMREYPNSNFVPGLRAYLANVSAPGPQRDSALARLSRESEFDIMIAQGPVDIMASDLAASERIVRLRTAAHRPVEYQADGHLQLGALLLALGRAREAYTELDRADSLLPGSALVQRAEIALDSTFPVTNLELQQLRSSLRQRWHSPVRFTNTFTAENTLGAAYLHGALGIRVSGPAAAADEISWLSAYSGDETAVRLARFLAAGLRAQSAARAGRDAEALRILERRPFANGRPEAAELSTLYSFAADRMLRAQLLEQLGHAPDAVNWYRGVWRANPRDLHWYALAMLREAGAAAVAGRKDVARVRYQQFLRDWQHADPELRPVLDHARAALAAL